MGRGKSYAKRVRDDRLRKRIVGNLCVYCGEPADTLDHFPPLMVTTSGLLLPACHQCNGIAGTKYAFDFIRRVYYVKERLREKCKHELMMPDWCEEETASLGPVMKKEIESWQRRRSRAIERLAWNAMPYLVSIDHNNYFVQLHAEWGETID